MITRTTETAIRILMDLATLEKSRVVSLGELHGRVGGSQTYLAKVTAALTRARIVRSSRGSQGGLTLARRADEIRLLDVVVATQGLPTAAYCHSDEAMKAVKICGFHQVMSDLHNAIIFTLEGRTIADLVLNPCGITENGHEFADCRMSSQKK